VLCQINSYVDDINMWSYTAYIFRLTIRPQCDYTRILPVKNWKSCLQLVADALKIWFEILYNFYTIL